MDMPTFTRRAAPPEQGWFQIGEVPEQTPPRRRGQGRVSFSATQGEAEVPEPEPRPRPSRAATLEHANGAAVKALEQVIERPYGALALCATTLLLALILVVMVASR